MSIERGRHVREHGSLLAGIERRVLVAIARRLPGWVTPDRLSALGLASIAGAGAAFAAFSWTPWASPAVVAALAANWFGDSLDGTLARVRGVERPRYGYYVDHVLDLAGSALLFAGLACSGLMSPVVALAVLAAYLLVSAEAYLATHAAGVFRLSCFGVGPTELRIVLAAGTLQAARNPWISIADTPVRLFDLAGIIAVFGLAAAFVASSVANARALAAAEPVPPQTSRAHAA